MPTSATVASTNVPVATVMPEVYHKFKKVCCTDKASGVPPHIPFGCATDLLLDTMPPFISIFPMSPTDQHAMEEYVHKALKQAYICPSTSQASGRFFFVEKNKGPLTMN